MQWVDFLPVKSVVGVLENAFFPRWLQFLMTWLNQFPNYEEVQNWYTWWRAQFQEPLMSDPVIVRKYYSCFIVYFLIKITKLFYIIHVLNVCLLQKIFKKHWK